MDLTKEHTDLKSQFLWETINAVLYKIGGIVFIVGSVFFLSTIGWLRAGAYCFVAGSLLFVTGASDNVLKIVRSRSLSTLQLMNLPAIAFVVGSVLFTVASVPYLSNSFGPRKERL
jgi:UDP-N-acetylmuramyl pentapeptide phosphotransferase/UDP-N-acetylglucosamine-1-phosphate transferase